MRPKKRGFDEETEILKQVFLPKKPEQTKRDQAPRRDGRRDPHTNPHNKLYWKDSKVRDTKLT